MTQETENKPAEVVMRSAPPSNEVLDVRLQNVELGLRDFRADVDKQFDDFKADVDKRFDKVDKRFDRATSQLIAATVSLILTIIGSTHIPH